MTPPHPHPAAVAAPVVRTVARRLARRTRHDADDLAGDGYLAVLHAADRLDAEGWPDALVATIAFRGMVSAIRKHHARWGRVRRVSFDKLAALTGETMPEPDGFGDLLALADPADRDAIDRRFRRGQTYRAIAAAVGRDRSSVAEMCRRGLARLRSQLDPSGVAAGDAGTNGKSVSDAKRLKAEAPALLEKVKAGG